MTPATGNALDAIRWQRLLVLFDELGDLPQEQREQRLRQMRASDEPLAERLAAMLASDQTGDGPLDHSLEELAPDLHAQLPGHDDAHVAGDSIGHYRLIRRIGSGGMGEVWLAERADGAYQQQVALKLLKRGMDTDAILQRFRRERSILARLAHPNIVRLLDGGVSPDGRPFYVMEHVDGSNVTTYANAQALAVRARVALLAVIADAVAYAHAQLVVHRDLKPSNVLVDAAGTAHLLDFGIAKLLTENGEQTLTGTGMRLLSPAYASPEQIRGEPVGTATDVYALGVLLFELLTGRLPHQRRSRDPGVLASGLSQETSERASQALAAVDDLRPLYGRNGPGRQLARELAGDLDVIVAKALHPEPGRRYLTAAALADDLRRWLGGRTITARPDSLRYRSGKFVRRNRLAVGAAILVLASLIAGLGLALWQAGIARQAATDAHAAQTHAQEQATIATAVTDFLVRDVVQAANPFGGKLRIPLTDALIDAGARIDDRFRANPRLRGILHREIATALDFAGEQTVARQHAEIAADSLRTALPGDDPDLQQARLVLGRMRHVADHYADARSIFEEGLAALAEDAPARERLPFLVALAGIDVDERKEAQAIRTLSMIEPGLIETFGEFEPEHLQALDHLMRAYSQTERFEESLAVARKMLAATENAYGVGHPLTLRWKLREAAALTTLERHEQALPIAVTACEASERSLGADHDATVSCRLRQAVIEFELERFDQAATRLETVVAHYERNTGPDGERTWLSWIWLARARQQQGRLDEARALFQRTDAAARRVHGPDNALALPYRQTLGMFLHQTGRLADALALRMDIFEASRSALPEGHVNIAKYAWDVAETLAAQHDDDAFVPFAETWLPRWEALFGDSENRVPDARAWLAAANARQAAAD